MLKVTLTKGLVGKKDTHKKVIKALGLRKFGSFAMHHDTPTIRGMVNKVHYLVTVTEEVEGQEPKAVLVQKAPKVKAAPAKVAAAKAPKAEKKAPAKKPAAKAAAKAK